MAKKMSAIPNIDKNLNVLNNLRVELNRQNRLFGNENQYLFNLIEVLNKFRVLDIEVSDDTAKMIDAFLKNIAKYQKISKSKENKESKIYGYGPEEKIIFLRLEDLLITDAENFYAALPNDAQRKAQRKNVESMLGPIAYNLVGHYKELAEMSVGLHDERLNGDMSIPDQAENDDFVIPSAVDVPRGGGRVDRVNILSPYLPIKEKQVVDAVAVRAIHINLFGGPGNIYDTNIKPFIKEVYSKVHRIDGSYEDSTKRGDLYKKYKEYWESFDPKKDAFSSLEKRAKYDEAMKYNMSYFDFFAMEGEPTLPRIHTSKDIAEKCTTRLTGVKTYDEFKNSATYRCDQLLPANQREFDTEEKYLRYVNSDLFVQDVQRRECQMPVSALSQLGLYKPVLNASDKKYQKLQKDYVSKYGGSFVIDSSGDRRKDVYIGSGGIKSAVDVLAMDMLTDDQYKKLKYSYAKTYGGMFVDDPSGDKSKDTYVKLDVQMYYRKPQELEKKFWELASMTKSFSPVKVKVGDDEKFVYNPVAYDIADREMNPTVVKVLSLVGAVAILLPYGSVVANMLNGLGGLFPAGSGDETTNGDVTTTPEDITVPEGTTGPNGSETEGRPDDEVTTVGGGNEAVTNDEMPADTSNNWGPSDVQTGPVGGKNDKTDTFDSDLTRVPETTVSKVETEEPPKTETKEPPKTETTVPRVETTETTKVPETTRVPEITGGNPAIGGAGDPSLIPGGEETTVGNPATGEPADTNGVDTSYENVEPGKSNDKGHGFIPGILGTNRAVPNEKKKGSWASSGSGEMSND